MNDFVEIYHFKLENIKLAIDLLQPLDFMYKLDLKDAYFLIPVCHSDRQYLRFEYAGKLWQFSCLPFGLSSCPFVFTKVMKPIIQILRSEGITVIIYLDDILVMARSEFECKKNTQRAIDILKSLGFIINFNKSNLSPSRYCKFVGFIIDSQNMQLCLPTDKRYKIKELVRNFIKKKSCKIEEMAKLSGVLASSCLGVKYGWLYYKSLEREKYLALKLNNKNMSAITSISTDTVQDLLWWEKFIMHTVNPIRIFAFRKEIFSDASLSGWGAVHGRKRAHVFWDPSERKRHINYLEILAAFFALKCFAAKDRNCQILLRIDNCTAIAYINKLGGVKFPAPNAITRELWQWCEARNIWVFAEYIASKENFEADAESRVSNIDTEWGLSMSAFNEIQRKFGKPTLDLFASRINKKCRRYCSWQYDPEATLMNVFTCCWAEDFWYAFPPPPFSLIPRVLRKIREDEARGIVVAPLWPTQAWFPEFERMLLKDPIILGPSNDLLLSPCRKIQHPLASQLSLIVGVLCGKPSQRENSQSRLWK